jgi:hypothetical protein
MNFTSLDDAFPDKPWPKRHPISSSKHVPEQRDSEKEGRTFPTPQHRGQHAIQKHKKTIDDLTSSLPISDGDENFTPQKAPLIDRFVDYTCDKLNVDNEITVFSRDEAKHYYMKKHYPLVNFIVGDFEKLRFFTTTLFLLKF